METLAVIKKVEDKLSLGEASSIALYYVYDNWLLAESSLYNTGDLCVFISVEDEEEYTDAIFPISILSKDKNVTEFEYDGTIVLEDDKADKVLIVQDGEEVIDWLDL